MIDFAEMFLLPNIMIQCTVLLLNLTISQVPVINSHLGVIVKVYKNHVVIHMGTR